MRPEIEISVLCPTRRRHQLLRQSYESLLRTADDPERIELLTAVDPDDDEDQPFDLDQSVWWTASRRYGWGQLHEYYNELARVARGRWLVMWNDDARMDSPAWDTVIAGQPEGVLWLESNDQQHCNVFPAWPKRWTDHLGHVSMSPHADTWVQRIGERLGMQWHVPVHVFHERVTSTDDLATRGTTSVGEFNEMEALWTADAERIRGIL